MNVNSTKIYIIRHGESVGNLHRICLGHTDLDLTELADACEMGMISGELLQESLRTTNRLLETIYRGDFGQYMKYIDEVE